MSTTRPRLVLVDDESIVRRGLALVLQAEFDVVGEAGSASEAVEIVPELDPDLVLVDLHLGEGRNGLSLIRSLKQQEPDRRTLVLSGRPESLFAERAFEVGALGFVTKDVDVETLMDAVRSAASDQIVLSESIRERFEGAMPESTVSLKNLSAQERTVVQAIAGGATTPGQVVARTELDQQATTRAIWQLQLTLGLSNWLQLVLWSRRQVQ